MDTKITKIMNNNFVSRRKFVEVSGALAATFLMGGIMSACSGNSQNGASGDQAGNESGGALGKVLVAYFSAQGNTRRVALALADELGADLFEIVPQDEYTQEDLDWTDENSRVTQEHDNEDLRDVTLAQNTPSNWENYDTVFVGYPIWWGVAGWACDTFVKSNDFEGKQVIPFCTSSSSGIEQSVTRLEEMAGSGNWQSGMRFASSASDAEVRSWASALGV